MRFLSFFLIGFSLLFLGCKKDNKLQYEKDEEIIQSYISTNNLSATRTDSGLYVAIKKQGTGKSCSSFSNVRVAYKGYYTNGTVFDESDSTGVKFNLQSVIKGWTEGIPFFKEGGEGILLVPSALGYGEKGAGTIPANTVLVFDIKLLEVI